MSASTWSTSTTATARGIAVVVTPGSGTRAVAEGVFAHALALVKRLRPFTDLVRHGRWARTRGRLAIGDLDGATIGIIGYGRIGRRVGELAAAFGMRVLAYDPFTPPPAEMACSDLDELVAASDVLTLHVPLTEENHHLVDDAFLGRVRPGAILINCGRGGLRRPRRGPRGAGVRAARPASASTCSSPNRRCTTRSSTTPSVVLTPHLMGLTRRGHGCHLRRRSARRRRCALPRVAGRPAVAESRMGTTCVRIEEVRIT